jgi:hypothetical protein
VQWQAQPMTSLNLLLRCHRQALPLAAVSVILPQLLLQQVCRWAEFGALIQKNGNAMTAFGTTTEGGASNFARVSQNNCAAPAVNYMRLGFSTQDINQGLASYGALMKSQGLQGKKSNAELAQGAKSYLKEMDALAKATGQSRSQIEESMAADG